MLLSFSKKIDKSQYTELDDSAEQLAWATELGATIIHVLNFKTCNKMSCQQHINQLNELPQLFSKFTSN
ncbi:MAG: hypothetical protein ACFE95_07380 [Candidatus Hodarchaeota archaeon]